MQVPLAFRTKGGIDLDGVLIVPDELPGPFASVALCHPHPILGGNMDQPLVHRTARALERQGIASLRFNFRGVGESQGAFTMGKREPDDAKAALNLLHAWKSIDSKRIGVMGYSFGATIAVKAALKVKRVRALAMVAPPTGSFPRGGYRRWKRPSLIVSGQNDLISIAGDVAAIAEETGPSIQTRLIPGADHALAGHEDQVAEILAAFFARALAKK